MADVFGRMVADYHRDALAGQPVYERSDGDESPAQCAWYFAGPDEWGPLETSAIDACLARQAPDADADVDADLGDRRPRVLDAGCGPGRALDPLAERGATPLGIDESPGAVAVAREWTGRPAIVGDQATLPIATGSIDAALFLGTHVGAGGTVEGLRSLLAELDRAIAGGDRTGVRADERRGGRIVADVYDPTAVEADDLRAYLEDRWIADGVATRRFRLRYDGDVGRWRTLLMASPAALDRIVAPTPWSIARIERGEGTRYLFVLDRAGDPER
jgi:SAM-dependent methyltransferase